MTLRVPKTLRRLPCGTPMCDPLRLENPVFGEWQLAQAVPRGSDKLVSLNIFSPRSCKAVRTGAAGGMGWGASVTGLGGVGGGGGAANTSNCKIALLIIRTQAAAKVDDLRMVDRWGTVQGRGVFTILSPDKRGADLRDELRWRRNHGAQPVAPGDHLVLHVNTDMCQTQSVQVIGWRWQ